MGFSLQCGGYSTKIMTELKTLGLQVKLVKTGFKTCQLIYPPLPHRERAALLGV
jgi:hypothetical protein